MLDQRESLPPPRTKSDTQTEQNKKTRPSPVTNSFGSQQDSIVKVIICGGTVTESLSGMEDERDIKTQLLLAVHEAEEWDEVVNNRFRRIFWTDQIKSCGTNTRLISSSFSQYW